MNIIEAVSALKDGRCEAIIDKDMNWSVKDMADGVYLLRALSDDWQLVNPKPVMETVEVVRWMNLPNGDILQEHMLPQDMLARYWVKLTGQYQREVQPTVKRRVEIPSTAVSASCGEFPSSAPDIKFFAEWEE